MTVFELKNRVFNTVKTGFAEFVKNKRCHTKKDFELLILVPEGRFWV